MRRKLVQRINMPAALFLQACTFLAMQLKKAGSTDPSKEAVARLQRRKYPKGQWHRWYQVNRRRQRQLSALKQTGFKIHPKTTGMTRWMVR